EDFIVYYDTSNQGLGCVLMQRDHKSLQHIFNQKELNMRQKRWIELFSDYEYEIRYHPGKLIEDDDELERNEADADDEEEEEPMEEEVKEDSEKKRSKEASKTGLNSESLGGVIALTRWIEKMENEINNSGCFENRKMKYAASSFVNKVLTWWKTQVRVRAHKAAIEVADGNKVEIDRIIRDCKLELGNSLFTIDLIPLDHVRCGTLTKGNEKRKGVEETSKQGGWGNDNKRVKVSKGFVAATPRRNGYASSHPKYAKCWTYHPEGNRLTIEGNRNTRNNGNQAKGRAFNVNAVDALQDPNAMTASIQALRIPLWIMVGWVAQSIL
nr:hypothetical protein [Tanacetum cinerariifolium]